MYVRVWCMLPVLFGACGVWCDNGHVSLVFFQNGFRIHSTPHSNFVGKHRLPYHHSLLDSTSTAHIQLSPFSCHIVPQSHFSSFSLLLLLSLLLICHSSMSCNQVLLLAPTLSFLLPTQPQNRGQNVWKMVISIEGSKE